MSDGAPGNPRGDVLRRPVEARVAPEPDGERAARAAEAAVGRSTARPAVAGFRSSRNAPWSGPFTRQKHEALFRVGADRPSGERDRRVGQQIFHFDGLSAREEAAGRAVELDRRLCEPVPAPAPLVV